jgi:hypothetical protein
MIVVVNRKLQKNIVKAVANTLIMMRTNQNGKDAFNYKAANMLGMTMSDVQDLADFLDPYISREMRLKAKQKAKKAKLNEQKEAKR